MIYTHLSPIRMFRVEAYVYLLSGDQTGKSYYDQNQQNNDRKKDTRTKPPIVISPLVGAISAVVGL